MQLRISGLIQESIVDGPGIRFVIFAQGCDFHCEGCHNPQTWSHTGGTLVDTDTLYEKIKANPLIKGITISGGEPFLQSSALIPLIKKLKADGYEIAVYTGYCFEELLNCNDSKTEMAKLVDIIIDGRFILAQKSLLLKFKGSKNQRIINVQKSLQENKTVIETSERWGGVQ
ncbi:MAG TPA: anaerobic ribonucleoside-triphosphate reductase activating protein [Clostridia bacterium]